MNQIVALSNPYGIDMPLNKLTKPNYNSYLKEIRNSKKFKLFIYWFIVNLSRVISCLELRNHVHCIFILTFFVFLFVQWVAAGIGLHVNAHKTDYMCYNHTGDISTLDGTSLKLEDKFTYLGNSISSTEKDIDMLLTKAWTAINRLSIIWKSDLTDKMKRSFFQAAVVSILLYECTTWTLTKRLEKKLDGNYTRMLRAILNKSWWQHSTRHQLYGHLPPIMKTIQVRRTRHAGHC